MKKIISVLIVTLIFFTGMSKRVYADETEEGVEICVYDGSTEIQEHGDIVEENYDGLYVESYYDSHVEVTTGDITASDGDGAYLDAYAGGEIYAEVGDVEAQNTGVAAYAYGNGENNSTSRINVIAGDISTSDNDDAITIVADGGALVTVNAGELTAGEDGIDISTSQGSIVIVNSKGIDAVYDGIYVSENSGTGLILVGVDGEIAAGNSGINASLSADDTIFAANVQGIISGESDGVQLSTYSDSQMIVTAADGIEGGEKGVNAYAEENGSIVVNSLADITGSEAGIYAIGDDTGTILVQATNVSSDEVGVLVSMWADSSLAVAADTISGDLASIAVDQSEQENSNVDIFAWKIELNENGNVAEGFLWGDVEYIPTGADEEFEQNNIHYLIKLEQPEQGATISVTDEEGGVLNKFKGLFVNEDNTGPLDGETGPLDGETGPLDDETGPLEDEGLDMAQEGQKLLLKVDLEDGYSLKAAYNGLGEKVELLQDDEGNYYVIVPKGGAVYLSVELEGGEYEILEQPEDDYVHGSGETYTVKASGDVDKVEDILVDDESAGEGAQVTAGSTVVTLLADFLDSLSLGSHKLTFKYIDGAVSTLFNIVEKSSGGSSSGESSTETAETTKTTGKFTPVKTGVDGFAVNDITGNNTLTRTIGLCAIAMVLIASKKRKH